MKDVMWEEIRSQWWWIDEEDMFEKADSYSFTENELKEIVTSSVQNALEKSIAASLVELAVSELKTHVSRIDQS